MTDFFIKFAELLMSQAGVIACLLFISNCYDKWQLYQSAKENKKLNDQILRLATSQVSAMKELQSVLDKVVGMVRA